jgi:flagellin-like protein
MKSFRRNLKGISPIFATLILIAIAVIAGVVVYMFTSGTLATMTGGGTAVTEKASVQGVTLSVANGVTAYAQSTNNVAISINNIIIKNSNGDIVASLVPATNPTVLTADGALVSVVNSTALTSKVTAGTPYSVTITSTKGGSFVASGVVAGT